MPPPLLIAVYSFPVLYLVWRIFRNYLVRSPLDNIPGPPSKSVIAGNMRQLFASDSWPFIDELVDTYGPVSKLNGYLGTRWLHVYDVKALNSIYLKDQDIYYRETRGSNIIFGPGLLGTIGPAHRKQRKMLTPAFSAAHMREMTPFFYVVARKLRAAIDTRVRRGDQVLDMVSWMSRTALELIGQGGIGHSFDPLIEDAKDEYTEAVKSLIPAFVGIQWIRVFIPLFAYMGPAWFRRMLLDLVPIKGIQRMKNISDTLYQRSLDIYKGKLAALERGDDAFLQQVGEGKDIMSILLRANVQASDADKLPDNEIIAQMSTFLLAGVDTTSNALSRVLHLLAQHQDVQDKLRSELVDARERYGEDIPYDEVMQLPYMDAICRETLRLYSPVTFSMRIAGRDAVLPLHQPLRGVDGKIIQEVPIPKGTVMLMDLKACNNNKALWGEDALEWKPERWLKPLPREVEEARIPGIYANLMTFISGGHSCIGFKFSQLEMKVVLSVLCSNFRFTLSDKPFVWNFAGVTYPAANKDTIASEMYLKVDLVSA